MDNSNSIGNKKEKEVRIFPIDENNFDEHGKCKRCNGVGKLIKGPNRTKSLCQHCGGNGIYDWISEIMGKTNIKDGLYVMEDGRHVIIKKGKRIT